MISVANQTGSQIVVAVNTWGRGDTSNKRIAENETQNFDRSDPRGLVMALSQGASQQNYYVFADSSVVVQTNRVVRDGRNIEPLT